MADSTATTPSIFRLPDELLEAIVSYLPPSATIAFGSTCRRNNKITFEPLVWRRHCVQKWRYWEPRHELEEKLEAPPAQTKWQQLYNERARIDREALELFDQMLPTQQLRCDRMEKIAAHGYDVKDLMLHMKHHTAEEAEDVLARRYHAHRILGQIHRAIALDKWTRLANMQMVKLEEVLGAFDLFALNGVGGDLRDVDHKFDQLAKAIRDRDEEWDELSTRTKAIRVARYLRSEDVVGNPNIDDYHALRNNYLSLALFKKPYSSLPLQSVAIYCAVCRRLGIDAKPANYPQHVYAVIRGPRDQTLDGKPRPQSFTEPEMMHMDPWRNSEEMPIDQLRLRLLQMGAQPHQHEHHLGPASSLEIAVRASRNIQFSVSQARDSQRRGRNRTGGELDIEAAWYSMLWAVLMLGSNSAQNMHHRRQSLAMLIEHFQTQFPEDFGLIEKHIPPMFDNEREHEILLQLIETARASDRNKKAPSPRNESTSLVRYKVGHTFTHRRYGYQGFIVGWNIKCGAQQQWIDQMGVNDLPRGREQPFYHVVADDKTTRYVAEENIAVRSKSERPCEALMELAGRYFKRWDSELGRFVNNITDEYPDD